MKHSRGSVITDGKHGGKRLGGGREGRRNRDTLVIPVFNVPSTRKFLDLGDRSPDVFFLRVVD